MSRSRDQARGVSCGWYGSATRRAESEAVPRRLGRAAERLARASVSECNAARARAVQASPRALCLRRLHLASATTLVRVADRPQLMLLSRTRTLHRQLAARPHIPLARMSHHPPFKQVSELSPPSSSPDRPRTLDCSPAARCGQVEGSRPEFDTTQEWTTTKVRPSRCPLEPSSSSSPADGILPHSSDPRADARPRVEGRLGL